MCASWALAHPERFCGVVVLDPMDKSSPDEFGARRIVWSSNYPAHPKFGGVKERLDIAQKELAFLSKADQAWIFGETALSLYPSLRSS